MDNDVVPHGGTWIEIGVPSEMLEDILSYLTEVRGLKSHYSGSRSSGNESYLTEVRGLKCRIHHRVRLDAVVPHGGTWIEIAEKLEAFTTAASYLTEVRGLKFVCIMA